MSETETRDEPMAGSPLCDAEGHAWVWTWPIEGGEGSIGQCSLCGWITTAERDAANHAEMSRLRGVVEAVQALADEWGIFTGDDDDFHEAINDSGAWRFARDLRAVLAVSSSGEAESREATCATCGGDGFIPEADDPDYPEADVHQTHCPDCPAPVPPGGPADGEGDCCGAFVEAACEVGHRILIDDGDGTVYACPACALAARPVQQADGEAVKRSIRTLLPGLRVANYSERWAANSPAVQALTMLCEYVGEPVDKAGDLVDPDVLTAHVRRPAARPVLSREALARACWIEDALRDGVTTRAWAEAAWDDMGGSDAADERVEFEMRAGDVLAVLYPEDGES